MQSIVKKNSLALVGAVIYQIQKTRSNGKPYFVNKYTLPDTTGPPRYDANEQLLFRPEWILSARYNRDFIDAVVDAVGKVRVSLFLLTIQSQATTDIFSRPKMMV